jgi:hypothetical protein
MSKWYFNPEFSGARLAEWMKNRRNRMIQHAKFAAFFRKDHTRLNQLVEAADCIDATNLEEWLVRVQSYPRQPLEASSGAKYKKRLTRLTGKDVAVRACILKIYIRKILDILDAPETIKNDLTVILDDYAPQSSEAAEIIQRAFLDNPEYGNNISKMAADIGVHRATIQDLIANAIVVSSADQHWRGPWPWRETMVHSEVPQKDPED